MSNNFSLDVQRRTVQGKHVKHLRSQGILPAVVYGKGFEPVAVQVDERTFFNVYRKTGRNSLIDLTIPGIPTQSVFVHEIQRHPVTRVITHADFRVVDLKVKIYSEVPLTVVGESPLIERGDAVVNQSLQQVQVYALPANIPSYLEVDISVLDSFDKNIHVRDLAHSAEYELVTEEDLLVVSLSQTRKAVADEEEETGEAEEQAEPELIRREQEDKTEE